MKVLRGRAALYVLAPVVLLALAFGLAALFKREKPIPPEKIVEVKRGDIARSVVAIGKVEPRSKVEVKSKANGIIEALLVDVGDEVKEGQVLAELDKENLRAQVREAQATLDGAQASLNVAIAAEGRARIDAANPELTFAQKDYERVAALFENKIASQQQLDEAARVLETAKNRRQSLEAALRSAEAEVTQAKARVAASQAALDRAQENLKYSTICSPIDGVVLSRNTEIGDAVSSILNLGSAATLIMTLGDMSSVYVKGKVDEADVGKIRVGLPVRTSIESYPGESFAGSVTRIAPMGWEQNNVTTFEVRVSISNPERRLRVNMSANAEVVLEERKNTLLIPEAALLYDKDNKPSVQRLAASANPGFTRIPVKTGISNGRQTEILEGLSQGERLVLP